MPRKFGLLAILIITIAGCSSDPSSFDVQTAIAETSQAQPVSTKTKVVRTATPTSTPIATETPLPKATMIPTETSIPTPTKVPLDDLDLEAILFRSGDLPPSIATGQISTDIEMSTTYRADTEEGILVRGSISLGSPANAVSLKVHHLDAPRNGSVNVFVYKTEAEAIFLYDQVIEYVQGMDFYERDFTMAEAGEAGSESSMTSFFNLLYGRNDKGTILQETVFLRCNTVVIVSLILDSRGDTANVYAMRLDERLVDLVCPNIPQDNR